MDYFNTVLKRRSMKLAGTSIPFCKVFILKPPLLYTDGSEIPTIFDPAQ